MVNNSDDGGGGGGGGEGRVRGKGMKMCGVRGGNFL